MGDKEFLLGYLTLADFYLHIIMKNYKSLSKGMGVKDEFAEYENLKKHLERIY